MKKPSSAPLQKKRQQTDDSLNLERDKTDQSLEVYNQRSENKTDRIVQEGRDEADKTRDQRRAIEDVESDSSVPELSPPQLSQLRSSEDLDLQNERHDMDVALQQERSEKDNQLDEILARERGETDKNLLSEREKADAEAHRTQTDLSVEKSEHIKTKTAMTTQEEFLAIVSHDLRNPIGVMLSCAQVILDEPNSFGMTAEGLPWIEMIKRNAETSLRLIRDILDMESIVDGKIALQKTELRISQLIQDTQDTFLATAVARGVHLSATPLTSESLVNCDKDRIAQVLSNLVSNALKFTPKGGAVNLTTHDSASDIEISVTDTGPGIPPGQLGRIFERFTQLGTPDRRGIGLGLYIAKTLVESHQGQLWVESRLGHGSTFRFTLPKGIH